MVHVADVDAAEQFYALLGFQSDSRYDETMVLPISLE
jgi:predicted lactoylglutathione lyase